MNWVIRSTDASDTERLGKFLGSLLKAPETIELRSDLGGGKTTFVRGLARGFGSKDKVGSPTFTLNKIYKAGAHELHHYDFYRLSEPGILSAQLEESLQNPKVITAVEWSSIVKDVLPPERIAVEFKPVADNPDERVITFEFPQSKMEIIEKLRTKLTDEKT